MHFLVSLNLSGKGNINGSPAMTASINNEALSNAIVQAVETGAYPEAEEIASSEIGPTVLPDVLKELGEARQRVQVSRAAFALEMRF